MFTFVWFIDFVAFFYLDYELLGGPPRLPCLEFSRVAIPVVFAEPSLGLMLGKNDCFVYC